MSPKLDIEKDVVLTDVSQGLSFTLSPSYQAGDIVVKMTSTYMVLLDAGFEPEDSRTTTAYIRNIQKDGVEYVVGAPVEIMQLVADMLDENRADITFMFYPHAVWFDNLVMQETGKRLYFPTNLGKYKNYEPKRSWRGRRRHIKSDL